MTLWTGNGAVLKSSSQWQLKELLQKELKNKICLRNTNAPVIYNLGR